MVDAAVLGRWLDANAAPGDGEEPVIEQLSGGSQNTLYLIHRGDHRMVLRMPLVGQVGVGALAGFAAERQRVPDQKQLHPHSLACVGEPLASRERMLFSRWRVRCADVGRSGTGALAGRERGAW